MDREKLYGGLSTSLLKFVSMTLQTVANQPHAMQMHFEALHVPVVKCFKL